VLALPDEPMPGVGGGGGGADMLGGGGGGGVPKSWLYIIRCLILVSPFIYLLK
jgi:hypothetical protein